MTGYVRTIFVVLTSCIFLSAYFIFISMDNVFQAYVEEQNMSAEVFDRLNLAAFLSATTMMALCAWQGLQSLSRQRFLMIALVSVVIVGLLLPISLTTYPIISASSNVIFNLTEPWRQLFVSPAIRATVEGLTEGLSGVFDLTSITIESSWAHHLERYRYMIPMLLGFVACFWFFTRALQHQNPHKTTPQTFKSIRSLLAEHPYIFLAGFFAGMSEGVFDYTFVLGQEALGTMRPEDYQYIFNLGGIAIPIIIGWMADKKGILFLTILSGFILATCKLISSAVSFLHVTTHLPYYALGFLGGGLSACMWVLSSSLVGERLRALGIFRSFALANVAFCLGTTFAGFIYEQFAGDDFAFAITKIVMSILDILLMGLLWRFHLKEKGLKEITH